MTMHWRDIEHRLEPAIWDGLLISIPHDRKPGFAISVCPHDRLRISARGTPVFWARICRDYYGYEFLRRLGGSSWSIIPPIPFELAHQIADSEPHSRLRQWSRHFADWLWESEASPLDRGDWMLNPRMRWPDGPALASRDIEGIAAHERREYVDWDREIYPIPLRDISSAESGRVKAFRKLARNDTLPPVLLYWISGLTAYVVLDGHDRLLAAQLEQTPAPFLCLNRSWEMPPDGERQQLVMDAVDNAFRNSNRRETIASRTSRSFTHEKANRILLDAFTPLRIATHTMATSPLLSPELWEAEVIAEGERQGVDVAEMIGMM